MAHLRATRLVRASSCCRCCSQLGLPVGPRSRRAAAAARGAGDRSTARSPRRSTAPEAGWPDAAGGRIMATPSSAGLIEGALAGSPTMDEAAARVRRAMAVAQQAGAAAIPRSAPTPRPASAQQSTEQRSICPPGIDLPHQLERHRPGRAQPDLRPRPVGPQPRHPARRAVRRRGRPRRRRPGPAHPVDRDRRRLWRPRPAGRGPRAPPKPICASAATRCG